MDLNSIVLTLPLRVPVRARDDRLDNRSLRGRVFRVLIPDRAKAIVDTSDALQTRLVKTHPRMAPGDRSTDSADFPAVKSI